MNKIHETFIIHCPGHHGRHHRQIEGLSHAGVAILTAGYHMDDWAVERSAATSSQGEGQTPTELRLLVPLGGGGERSAGGERGETGGSVGGGKTGAGAEAQAAAADAAEGGVGRDRRRRPCVIDTDIGDDMDDAWALAMGAFDQLPHPRSAAPLHRCTAAPPYHPVTLSLRHPTTLPP